MGGPNKYYDYSTKNMKHIFSIFYKLLKKHNFQLVVIPSMRTPLNTIHYAKEFFGENHTIIMNVDKKAYLSALGLSENIVVTCDSSSMISEAALTGKPIYVANILPKRNDKRFQNFRNCFICFFRLKFVYKFYQIWKLSGVLFIYKTPKFYCFST